MYLKGNMLHTMPTFCDCHENCSDLRKTGFSDTLFDMSIQILSALFSENMVVDTVMLCCSLLFETYAAPADLQLLISLLISIICQYVYQLRKSTGSGIHYVEIYYFNASMRTTALL
jgi:hypothetical protein